MCRSAGWEEIENAPPLLPEREARPTWEKVEEVIAVLAATQATMTSSSSRKFQVARYEPGWRLFLVTDASSRWVEIEDIRTCWETLERLGRIRREDVLEPGRCASFMMVLFREVPGTHNAVDDENSLVLA